MKRVILAVVGVGALIGLGLTMNRSKMPAVSEMEKEIEVASDRRQMEPRPVNREGELRQGTTQRKSGTERSLGGAAAAHFDFSQPIETLVSRRASFREKQAA